MRQGRLQTLYRRLLIVKERLKLRESFRWLDKDLSGQLEIRWWSWVEKRTSF
jgi:hypothetical protein